MGGRVFFFFCFCFFFDLLSHPSLNPYIPAVCSHRNIKGFMFQTGDPTGTGKGGECIWGGKFADEIRETLKHSARGIVSMANSGANTNGSQFFITYAKAPHLDRQCVVFVVTFYYYFIFYLTPAFTRRHLNH